MLDETTHATKQHEAMVENHRSKFVGIKNLIKECLKQMKEITSSGGTNQKHELHVVAMFANRSGQNEQSS
jgi:hypothetical protein